LEELKTAEKFWQPWILIVTAPRNAWKTILSRNPYSDWRLWVNIVFLSAIGALSNVFHPKLSTYPKPLLTAIVICVMFVVELFLIFLISVVFGAFAKWLGKWMGGTGGYQKMQAVQVWASLPHAYLVILWILAIILGGQPILNLYHIYGYGMSITLYIGLLWLTILVGLGYAEAHDLPTQKGMLLSILCYMLPTITLISLVNPG